MVGTAQGRLCPPYEREIAQITATIRLRRWGRFRHSGVIACVRSPFPEATARPMTADTDSDLPPLAHEPARRSGSIVLVLMVAGAIVAAAVAFMTLGRAQAQPY